MLYNSGHRTSFTIISAMTTYTVHTRSRYGVYQFLGTMTRRFDAYQLMADHVTKGYAASVWIRADDEKVYEWDHEHDTLRDALWQVECLA